MDNYTKPVIKSNFIEYSSSHDTATREIEKQEELINKIKVDFSEIKEILNSIIDKNSTKG